MMMDEMYTPPQNLEAEQAVLGSMLIERQAIDRIVEVLQPEDFYRDAHRFIYESILALVGRSEPVDMITLSDELKSCGRYAMVGGVIYLQNLMEAPSSAANIEFYGRVVRDAAARRGLMEVCGRLGRLAYDQTTETPEVMDRAESEIFALTQQRQSQGFSVFRKLLDSELDAAEMRQGTMGGITGRATGFDEFDFKTGGLQRGDLWIIGARPSMGKTALGVQMAVHIAVHDKMPVAVFSLEMSQAQLTQRILCSGAKVDLHLFRAGAINSEAWMNVGEEAVRLHAAKLFIDDQIDRSVMEMRAACRRLASEHGPLGMVLVDYLQIMRHNAKDMNRAQELGEIAKGLKGMAKELNVPVVALAQVGRSVESRPNKRPMLSDLRESGEIEAVADGVLFLYRDAYYRKDDEQREDPFRLQKVELILAKHRNGPTGVVTTGFLPAYAAFEDFKEDTGPDPED
jgi:replicative DNA helicase